MLVAATVIGACSTPPPLTKAEYIAETNGACANATKQLNGVADTYVTDTTEALGPDLYEQFTRFTLIKTMRNTNTFLSKLTAASGDQGYVEGIYVDYAHALDLWYADPLGTSADTAAGAVSVRFTSYGMKDCAHMVTDAGSDVGKRLSAARTRAATASAKTTTPRGTTGPKG
jgi:hypothetical protein